MMADSNDMEGEMRNHITSLELAGVRFNPKTTGAPSVKLRRVVSHEKENPSRSSRGFEELHAGLSGSRPSRLPGHWFAEWLHPPDPEPERPADPAAETGIRTSSG